MSMDHKPVESQDGTRKAKTPEDLSSPTFSFLVILLWWEGAEVGWLGLCLFCLRQGLTR